MSAVPVTIVGMETRDDGTTCNVTIVGMASLTGLGVGGGPMPPVGIWPSPGRPAHPIAPGGPPPGIWPGPGPMPGPEHPIVLPPEGGVPPEQPPDSIWPDPPEGIAPTPEHPIYYPKPEPPAGTLVKWKVFWTPVTGWIVIGVPNVPHPVPSGK